MKLLFIIADGRPGGGTTFALNLLGALHVRGKCDCFFVCQADSYSFKQMEAKGIKTYGVDFFKSFLNFFAAKQLKNIINTIKPDIIHLNGTRAGFIFNLIKGNNFKGPVIYTVHGYHLYRGSFLKKILSVYVERRITKRASCQVFVSQADQAFAKTHKLTSKNCPYSYLIYNGIDFSQLPTRTTIVSKPTKIIGFLGRFDLPKNPSFVVEVLKALPESYKLVMVGGGELEHSVKQLIVQYGLLSRVKMLGELPYLQALQAIQEVSVVVMPSLWEALGLVAIEVMAMGIPVIAAAVGGLVEIISYGETGYLETSLDPALYAKHIQELCENEDKYKQFSIAAKQAVILRFNVDKMIEAYWSLYNQKVLEEKL